MFMDDVRMMERCTRQRSPCPTPTAQRELEEQRSWLSATAQVRGACKAVAAADAEKCDHLPFQVDMTPARDPKQGKYIYIYIDLDLILIGFVRF